MKYTVKVDDRAYVVEIENLSSRPIRAAIEGTIFEVWPENALPLQSETSHPLTLPVRASGSPRPPATGNVPSGTALNVKTVRAPIPGVIVEVLVKPGDRVEYGQTLFTVEAMKMRNAIRSSRAGEVAQVFVTAGQTVNHDENLLEYLE